eukprot:2892326-Lingulodinium_polyedra.AAC.1
MSRLMRPSDADVAFDLAVAERPAPGTNLHEADADVAFDAGFANSSAPTRQEADAERPSPDTKRH